MSGSGSRERHGGHFDKRKRRSRAGADESEVGIELTDLRQVIGEQREELAALHAQINSQDIEGVFDMQKAGERQRMAAAIWTVDFSDTMVQLRAANPEFLAVLSAQTSNRTPTTEISVMHKDRQLDGILLNVVRAQSIHKVPILTAAISVTCETNLVKREFHDQISFLMKGALMAESWVDKFLPLARAHRPAPTQPMIPGVMVTVFDNLTMNVGYHSMAVGGSTGEKLDMTNWFAVRVPRSLAPTLDGQQACASWVLEPAHAFPQTCMA